MSGASPSRALRTIILPLIKPAILASWVLLFINIVRELSMTVMLYSPKSTVLSVLMWDQMENGIVAALVLSALILITFVLASKVFKVNLVRSM